MNEHENFLKQVDQIYWKYAEILHESQHDFNIFAILLKNERDEVNLHSRFIFELLNPKGIHHQGDFFLSLFLQQIDLSDFRLKAVKVEKEFEKIDIFISNDNQAIIIENKIEADDQNRQLERYYEAAQKRGFNDIVVVYLNLYGTFDVK